MKHRSEKLRVHPTNALGKNHWIPLLVCIHSGTGTLSVEKRNIFSLCGPMSEFQKEKHLSITISSSLKRHHYPSDSPFLLCKSMLSRCDFCKNSAGVETENCSHTWRLRKEHLCREVQALGERHWGSAQRGTSSGQAWMWPPRSIYENFSLGQIKCISCVVSLLQWWSAGEFRSTGAFTRFRTNHIPF